MTALLEKIDQIIGHALTNTEVCELFFRNFNLFALTFYLLTSKERDIHCSHGVKQNLATRTHNKNLYEDTTYTVHHHVIHAIVLCSLTQNTQHPTS